MAGPLVTGGGGSGREAARRLPGLGREAVIGARVSAEGVLAALDKPLPGEPPEGRHRGHAPSGPYIGFRGAWIQGVPRLAGLAGRACDW